jgi:hypothetical protein
MIIAPEFRKEALGMPNPITGQPESSKAYNNRKAQNWRKDLPHSVPYLFTCRYPG